MRAKAHCSYFNRCTSTVLGVMKIYMPLAIDYHGYQFSGSMGIFTNYTHKLNEVISACV